jgi:hypothetical protein
VRTRRGRGRARTARSRGGTTRIYRTRKRFASNRSRGAGRCTRCSSTR